MCENNLSSTQLLKQLDLFAEINSWIALGVGESERQSDLRYSRIDKRLTKKGLPLSFEVQITSNTVSQTRELVEDDHLINEHVSSLYCTWSCKQL